MATISKGYSFGATETVTNAKLSSLVDSATISGIVNADCAAGMALASSKINYTGSGVATVGGTNTWTGANTFSGNIIEGTANQGDIWYDDGTKMTRLVPSTSGYFLKTQGAGADPVWAAFAAANMPAGTVVQVVNVMSGTLATGATALPLDDTTPQITEGNEFMTLAITPTSATNKLRIDVVFQGGQAGGTFGVALFQDATANALAAIYQNPAGAAAAELVSFTHFMDAGTTSSTTFRVRAGGTSTQTFNGESAGQLFNGVMASSITITEIKV